jgi:hypothetical protein
MHTKDRTTLADGKKILLGEMWIRQFLKYYNL